MNGQEKKSILQFASDAITNKNKKERKGDYNKSKALTSSHLNIQDGEDVFVGRLSKDVFAGINGRIERLVSSVCVEKGRRSKRKGMKITMRCNRAARLFYGEILEYLFFFFLSLSVI